THGFKRARERRKSKSSQRSALACRVCGLLGDRFSTRNVPFLYACCPHKSRAAIFKTSQAAGKRAGEPRRGLLLWATVLKAVPKVNKRRYERQIVLREVLCFLIGSFEVNLSSRSGGHYRRLAEN